MPRRSALGFPKLPWSELTNPDYIVTRNGISLLTSGMCGAAWKIHYTADFLMAAVTAGAVGATPALAPVAFFYPVFFLLFITHRKRRDEQFMRRKYGEDWVLFKTKVAKVWVPGVF